MLNGNVNINTSKITSFSWIEFPIAAAAVVRVPQTQDTIITLTVNTRSDVCQVCTCCQGGLIRALCATHNVQSV